MKVLKTLILFIAIFTPTIWGVLINCRFLNISWNTIGSMYTCQVNLVDIFENDSELKAVTGTHIGTYMNADVKAIAFDLFSLMKQIPKNIENFFPNLFVLSCKSGELTSVSAEQLKPFPNLKLFIVKNNKITTLDGDLFKYTPNIIGFWISENQISSVGQNLLSGLTQLARVYFQNNACINDYGQGRIGMDNLKNELLNRCPERCFIRCTINGDFDRLKTEVSELEETTTKYNQRLFEQEKKIDEQTKVLAEQKDKMIKLEAQFTEKLNEQAEKIEKHEQKLFQQSQELVKQKDELGKQSQRLIEQSKELIDLNQKQFEHGDRLKAIETNRCLWYC